ncbi:helix-turn-helix domain-containing protein [Cohnella fermenti]|uniref:ImmA/IrrE family metallo-endopeptidase n=1 Tax=Cohnella fermenti TaxID=2565925 RepID=A0A4S4BLQ4_9BACL|nr:XRE family transcriptional regulator [Cohnella fermenti]THF73271.1 ImmA/IrrE family metallo-endopeptidase [Cohnella fermenti]
METNRFAKFVPARLTQAREARGYTLSQLSEAVGISHQAISKYENNLSQPSFDMLEKISDTLNMPVTFFFKPISVSKEGVVFFRSGAMTSVKSKNVHKHKLNWVRDIHLYLEQFLNFPAINVPRIIQREYFIATPDEEIDRVAAELRRSWNLGNGPISNVSLLMEKNGVIVSRSPSSSYSIDACSIWEDGERPYVLLSDDKTGPRSRFDIAHELGHLVLHSKLKQSEFNQKQNYKIIEREANRFAGAFLLPEQSFGSEIYSSSLEYFISLKMRWKISIQAMAYRAHSLGVLTEYQHIYLRQKLAKQNQLTKEPLDEKIDFEEPLALRQAIVALVDHNVKTRQDILTDLRLAREEIEQFSNLDNGYFLEQSAQANIVSFKPKSK